MLYDGDCSSRHKRYLGIAENACGDIEAKLTKSSGDEIKSPILVHTSTGTFSVIELATNDLLCDAWEIVCVRDGGEELYSTSLTHQP